MGGGERDATAKTMRVARKRILARRGTVIATTTTIALVLWFVAMTTVLDMDLMAVMIAVQVNLNQGMSLDFDPRIYSDISEFRIGSFHKHSDLCLQNRVRR